MVAASARFRTNERISCDTRQARISFLYLKENERKLASILYFLLQESFWDNFFDTKKVLLPPIRTAYHVLMVETLGIISQKIIDEQNNLLLLCLDFDDANTLYLSVNVFSTKVPDWGHYFYVFYRRHDHHFTWSYHPRQAKVKPVCRPFKLVRPRQSNPRPPDQQLSALSTELILLRFSCLVSFPRSKLSCFFIITLGQRDLQHSSRCDKPLVGSWLWNWRRTLQKYYEVYLQFIALLYH